jgi:hypothetical protein
VDVGSRRTTPCPVCKELNEANADYGMASQAALARYEQAMRIADEEKQKRIANSTMHIRYITNVRTFLSLALRQYIWKFLTAIATPLILRVLRV